jgi:hypothetical protein
MSIIACLLELQSSRTRAFLNNRLSFLPLILSHSNFIDSISTKRVGSSNGTPSCVVGWVI